VFDYGRCSGGWEYTGEDYHSARATADDADVAVGLTTDLRLGFEGRRARARTTLSEGETAFTALSWSDHAPPRSYNEAFDRMERTASFWREWLDHGEFPDHPWRTYLQRSALTLKGLTYAPTGAMAAAATTSLPETPGGERNWDYRYTWIRDATFALWGLLTLGLDDEADDFFRFVADMAGAEKDLLQIMYGIGGERELPEEVLGHLGGYRGSRPVRIGNAAYRQSQHDVWGMLLDSVYLHTGGAEELPEPLWPLVEEGVAGALAHWRLPDRGIWEVRGAERHFTSSKLLCWVAVDRGARLAERRGERAVAERWRAVAP
jgi:alpha,alpha-trehalase